MTSTRLNLSTACALLLALPLLSAHAQSSLQSIESLPRLTLVEERRIGSVTDPNTGFSLISEVAVDRDGNIFVFEARDLHIRVYSPTGQLLRTISRRGDGPGEFNSSGTRMNVVGDTVWTSVTVLGCTARINRFSRAGTLLSTVLAEGVRVPIQGTGVTTTVLPRFLRPDGTFIGYHSCAAGGTSAAQVTIPTTDTVRLPRILFNASGAVADTLGWDMRPPQNRPPRTTITIEGRQHPLPTPATDEPLEVMLADGHVTVERKTPASASPATLRIVRTLMNGDVAWSQSLRFTPVRYSDAALDTIAHRSARTPGGSLRIINGVAQARSFANPSAAVQQIRARMNFPAFQIPIATTFLGTDESVWLRRPDDGSDSTEHILLDPQGRPRGLLDVPSRLRIAWARGDVVWAVSPDDDAVPWLVRYRIASARPPRPSQFREGAPRK
jgi:hypothetical protein